MVRGCEPQPRCPALNGGGTVRSTPRPGSAVLGAVSRTAALCEGGGLFFWHPGHWPNCCFLLSVGASVGPRPSIGSVFAPRKEEGGRDTCAIPCLAFYPSCPSCFTWDPESFLPMVLLQHPGQDLVGVLLWSPVLFGGCTSLPSLPALVSQPGWIQLCNLGGWPTGARLLVLRPTRGPGQALSSLSCARVGSSAVASSCV